MSPDGNDAQWYDSYDRTILNERYVLDYVMPYIDRHFRTIADRRGRAVAGLSNGGYGALHYAAKAPDRFVAAGSMSGNVGGRSFSGLGTPLFEGGPTLQEAGTYYYGNVPAELASNLDGVDLVINWGASCASDASIDLCATWGFEQAMAVVAEMAAREAPAVVPLAYGQPGARDQTRRRFSAAIPVQVPVHRDVVPGLRLSRGRRARRE